MYISSVYFPRHIIRRVTFTKTSNQNQFGRVNLLYNDQDSTSKIALEGEFEFFQSSAKVFFSLIDREQKYRCHITLAGSPSDLEKFKLIKGARITSSGTGQLMKTKIVFLYDPTQPEELTTSPTEEWSPTSKIQTQPESEPTQKSKMNTPKPKQRIKHADLIALTLKLTECRNDIQQKLDAGVGIEKLAKDFGVALSTMTDTLDSLGFKRRGNGHKPKGPSPAEEALLIVLARVCQRHGIPCDELTPFLSGQSITV